MPRPSLAIDREAAPAAPETLLERLATFGERIPVGGNHPFLLDDRDRVWAVISGRVDVYSVELADIAGEARPIDRQHLLGVDASGILWGAGAHDRVALLAVAATASEVVRVDRQHWTALTDDPALAPDATRALDGWLTAMSRGESLPRDDVDQFHRELMSSISARRQRAAEADAARLQLREEADRAAVATTFTKLAEVLDGESVKAAAHADTQPLRAACAAVCASLGVPVPAESTAAAARGQRDPLLFIASSVGLRARLVALRGEWWRDDHGPLVAYESEGRLPVALVPASSSSYVLHHPTQGRRVVTAAVASGLEPFAHAFYRRLPDRTLTGLDLITFGIRGLRGDLVTLVLVGIAAGLLGLVTPLATGLLFDTIIPADQRWQLGQLVVGLVLSAVSLSMFEVTRGFAVLRIEGRAGSSLQAALWDRLIDLPAGFFRDFTAGDLASRAFGVDTIRRTLSASAISGLLGAVFGLTNAALLFSYDPGLAVWALALVALAVAVAVASGMHQLRLRRPLATIEGRISGLVFELINGVAKLRVAGAERRAFTKWAREFAEQRRLAFATRAPLTVWNSVYPVVASMVLYGVLTSATHDSLSTGQFIAFVAAFNALLGATLAACQSALSMLAIGPTYQRLRPLLEAVPEIDPLKHDPGQLDGAIELGHVSFRYREDGPAILRDVSLRIQPGEFVAIVGSSGSGKSTLLRILLGFEKPTAGTVYYNGQDLLGLDLREVRRQIGVVLQNGKLLAGSILDNIIGSSRLTAEDALAAARMAGFDKDLEQMPMGLHTMVTEGGGTLSGGQRQRLMIARALVRRPRILFFDEATSALDNTIQATVSQSIEKLNATRIVIAHRLSTILHADRIVVMDRGQIAQVGKYEELLAQPGPFSELARRQLV